MSGRQSRSAISIGKFWSLGKTQEDALRGRERQLDNLERWGQNIERGLTRLQKLINERDALLLASAQEQSAGSRGSILAQVRDVQDQLDETWTLVQSAFGKYREVASNIGDSEFIEESSRLAERMRSIERRVALSPLQAQTSEQSSPKSAVKPDLPITEFGAKLLGALSDANARKR